MAKVVPRPELNLWERLYFFEIGRGLATTLSHAWRNLVSPANFPTLEYPEVKPDINGQCLDSHAGHLRPAGGRVEIAESAVIGGKECIQAERRGPSLGSRIRYVIVTHSLQPRAARFGVKVNSAHPGWVKTELGGPAATDEIEGSAETSVRLATLGSDGPNGGFFHKDSALPW